MLDLVKVQDLSFWIMYSALEMKQDSLTVPITDLVAITASTVKMHLCDATELVSSMYISCSRLYISRNLQVGIISSHASERLLIM